MIRCTFVSCLVILANISLACTTFLLKSKDQLVFGRNYDWITGEGVLHTNQKGLLKTSMQVPDGKTVSWASKYGSVTFNQYGKEFPTGGMNEKGLVVELMWLDGTQYATKDDRAAVGVLQWIQYQLDNCASVDEVIATDKVLRISKETGTPLHYLIADASGNAATIEFLDGKIKVHKGGDLPFPVLTNHKYDYSLKQLKKGDIPTDNSLERFVKTCGMVRQFGDAHNNTASPVDYSFDMLAEVAQGSFTKWRIVYDITNRKIYFKTLGHSDVKEIAFSGLNFSCRSVAKAFNMNTDGKGDIRERLVDFSGDINKQSIQKAFKESAERISVSEATKQKLINYTRQISCGIR